MLLHHSTKLKTLTNMQASPHTLSIISLNRNRLHIWECPQTNATMEKKRKEKKNIIFNGEELLCHLLLQNSLKKGRMKDSTKETYRDME